MVALLASLQADLTVSFMATTTDGSVNLTSVSSIAGLYLGVPVFGAGIPAQATIASLSPLNLSLPATANGAAVPLQSGFQTFGRRLKAWGQVAAQPALFLRDSDEDLEWQAINQRQLMTAELWVLSDAGINPDAVPGTALNNLLDFVASAFAPDDPMQGRFTLDGLVEWCRMSGKIIKDPGDLGKQAIAVADVEIFVP